MSFLKSCEAYTEFYDKRGKLKRIKKLKPWKLKEILIEKYRVKDVEAEFLARFLERGLKWTPGERASAQQLLDDPWLKMPAKYDARMDPQYYNEWMQCIDPDFVASSSEGSQEEGEGDESSSAGQQSPSNESTGGFAMNKSISEDSDQ